MHPKNFPFSIVHLPLLFIAACEFGMDDAARLARGQTAFDSSEYHAAIMDAKNILQQDPQNRDARLLLGRSALRFDDAVTAEKELHRALDLGADVDTVVVDLGKALLSLHKFEELLEEIYPELVQNEADRLAILRLRGDAMLELKRPSSARNLYLQILEEDGEDLPKRLGVVSTYVTEGKNAAARDALDEALAIDREYAPTRLVSGSLHLSAQDYEAAMAEFALAHELASSASDLDSQIFALIGMVEAQLAEGDLEAARAASEKLQDLAPDNLSSVYLAARMAFLDHDYEDAHAKLEQVLAVAPEFYPGKYLLVMTHFRRGNLGQAEMHLGSLISVAPDGVEARKLMAQIRLEQGRADEALDTLRPLLGSAETDAGALNLAVRARLVAEDYDNAIGYSRQEFERKPEDLDLQLNLAVAYLAAGRFSEAEPLLSPSPTGSQNAYHQDLLKILVPLRRGDAGAALRDAEEMAERWPEDPRLRNLIGGIALSSGKVDVARESYVMAWQLMPSELSAYFNLASIDVQEGDFNSAGEHYLAALEQQPNSVATMVALARLEASIGSIQMARKWLEKVAEADPTALTPRLLLARLYLSEHSFESAAQVATEAVRLDGANAEACNLLGLAQQGLNENVDALASFDQAVKLDPKQSAYRVNHVRAQAALGNYELAEQTLAGSGLQELDIQFSVVTAELKARQGDAEAALRIARDLQSLHPESAVPFTLEAELLAEAQQFAQAAVAYDKALSLANEDRRLALRGFQVRSSGTLKDPGAPLVSFLAVRPLDTELRLTAPQSLQARGERARLTDDYEQVFSEMPTSYAVLDNLAWEYFQSGDDRAEELARRAHEQEPHDGSVADTLGRILVMRGNFAEGVPMLRKAVEYSDGEPEVRYHLAAGLAASGNKVEARRVLEEILASKESFAGRQQAEALLTSL